MKVRHLALPLVFLQHLTVNAGLGDSADSVQIDKQSMNAVLRSTSTVNSAFTVHEMVAGANQIREYVNAQGVIFAVTWRGLKDPDLTTLLSTYYPHYVRLHSGRARTRGRQPMLIKTPSFVFQRGGHQRNLTGVAYLPEHLPAGVKPGDLQ